MVISEGHIKDNLSARLKLLKVEIDKVQPLTDSEIRQLIKACDLTTYTGLRELCVILLIIDTGIRIGELAQLRLDNTDLKNKIVKVTANIAKTRVSRDLPISQKTSKYLQELINIAEEMESDFIFQSVYGREIEKQNLELAFRRLSKKAGIDYKRCSPYNLMHYVQLDNEFIKSQHNKFSAVDKFIK